MDLLIDVILRAGRSAVFCRFAGCNLWSGREADRATAVCQFCDTDFVGTDGTQGGKYTTADALADTVAAEWPANAAGGKPLVICTGGEPLLQLDNPLIDALHARGFEIAIETNGTIAVPEGIDWVTCSPKGFPLRLTHIDEIKVVYTGQDLTEYAGLKATWHFLQPCSCLNTKEVVEYILHHPQWHLSLQTHKLIDIS